MPKAAAPRLVREIPYPHLACVRFISGDRLAAEGRAGSSSRLVVWSTTNWTVVQDIALPVLVFGGFAASPDGEILAAGDKTIGLYETGSGKHLRSLKGHRHSVNGLVFAPDGRSLATGSGVRSKGSDDSVRLWDVGTGGARWTWRADGNVHCVAFSRDGATVAAATARGLVHLLDAATGKPRAALDDLAPCGGPSSRRSPPS